MAKDEVDVVVVGAGIVGLAVALALHLEQRRVVVLDRDPPAHGCSRGNAGIICTSEIFPLASLHNVMRVPRMLFDPLGALAIRPAHVPRLVPWLARFALSTLPVGRRRAIDAIAALNAQALPAYGRLLDAADARSEIIRRGMIKIARVPADLDALRGEFSELHAHSVAAEILTAGEVGELEPALARQAAGGVFYPQVAHVSDPYTIASAFLRRLTQGGAEIRRTEVRGVLAGERGCTIATADGKLRARQTVIAAGLWSKALIEPFGLRAPVEAERGYHLSLPDPGVRLSRPIYFHRESFVATPLSSGLRLAGTAELAGPAAEPNWKRAEVLWTLARHYLPGLSDAGATRWMGCRPSFPDSLPALGRVARAPQVLYAFGHQHLGLTQAAISASCIAALANGRTPPVELSPLSLERFGRAG